METRLMKTLASNYAFPIFLVICFILLTFWLCRFFNNAAITNVPDNRAAARAVPAVPLRPNLRTLTTLAIICLFFSFVVGEKRLCDLEVKFKRIKTVIRKCDTDKDDIMEITNDFCTTTVEQTNDESICFSIVSLKLTGLTLSVVFISLITFLVFIRAKKRNRQN